MMRALAGLLLAIGLAALGWTGSAWFRTREVQKSEIAPSRVSQAKPRKGETIGRLSIPRLGISVVVLEGAETGTLRVAAGHVRGTALPGEEGNLAIAAHRDTFFRNLGSIHKGDEILMASRGGVQRYLADRFQVVGRGDTAVLHSSGRAELTLITCYPFRYIGPAPERFIVHAIRAGEP